MSKRRIGIFGGSFDPPHIGHLILAELARERLELDEVILVPAKLPPHKQEMLLSSAADRAKMAALAVSTMPHFSCSAIELNRDGPSYTIDTVRTITANNPQTAIYLLVGFDNLRSFTSWKEWRELLGLAAVVGLRRTGGVAEGINLAVLERITELHAPLIEISSTEIRSRVAKGLSIRHWVPAEIEDYVEKNGLYRR